MNGINWTLKFERLLALIFSKRIRPTTNNIFGSRNLKGIKYLRGYDLGLVTFINISSKIASKIHRILFVPVAATLKIHVTSSSMVLISSLKERLFSIDSNILNQADATVIKTLLFGNSKYSNEINLQILNASVDFILTSKRFDEHLLNF